MANEEQLKLLRQGVREWNAWRGGNLRPLLVLGPVNLSGADLRGVDLRGIDLREAILSGADLSGADLSGADLSGANLSRVDLRGATLRGPNLRGPNLRRANLREADLREANLREADLRGADLREANLREADLRGADLREADLSGAHLSGAHLSGIDLRGATLRGPILQMSSFGEADFSEIDLWGIDFRGAILRGANFRGADLSGADLREADLRGADLSGAILRGANFSEANLSSTVFAENDLTFAGGLETIKHYGPSRIDFRTVIFPAPGPILTTFLRGTGSSEYLIEAVNGRIPPFQPVPPIKVFISFAPSDQNLCQDLRNHLSLLVRSGMIALSHEEVLAPGIHQWEAKVSTAFQEAQVMLLLVSAPFLASHQAWKDVIEPALDRHERGGIRLIPIILRPTAWKGSPLAKLQSLPTDGKPVTEWEQIDTPLTEVSESIRKVVQPLHEALMEQAMKRRERDLVTANLILTKTQATEKQRTVQKHKKAVEEAEETCQKLQSLLQEAQRRRQDLKEVEETLLADLALLERTSMTLDEEVRTLDTQLQSREGMINGTGR